MNETINATEIRPIIEKKSRDPAPGSRGSLLRF
jgi:hypothetical protein